MRNPARRLRLSVDGWYVLPRDLNRFCWLRSSLSDVGGSALYPGVMGPRPIGRPRFSGRDIGLAKDTNPRLLLAACAAGWLNDARKGLASKLNALNIF